MMKWFFQLVDKWAVVEDDDVVRLMDKMYGPLMQYCMLFPSWKRSNIKLTIALICFYFFALFVHGIILAISVYKVRDYFDLASLSFHYFLILFFAVITLTLLNRKRYLMAAMHRHMTKDLGIYRTGRIYLDEKPMALEKNKDKEFLKFLLLPALILVIAAVSLGVPYVKKLIQEKHTGEAHYTSEGVNLNLPIAGYYPFPTHAGVQHLAIVAAQLLSGTSLAFALGGMEVFLFRLTQVIIFEYKVLEYGIETLLLRAKKFYIQANRGANKVPTSDPEFQTIVGQCFNDSICHHHQITRLVEFYEETISWPTAFAYAFGTGVIGLSLINMLDAKDSGNYENLVIFTMLMLAEVINMYIVSRFGEDITTESKILRDVLYDIDWHKLNTKNRRLVLNFQVGVTNPVIVKAGGHAALCMDTFSSIINTAYSFFNLVNAN